LSAAIVVVVLGILVYLDVRQDSLLIEPISVPQSLEQNGYTPQVAAQRLRDALNEYMAKAQVPLPGEYLAEQVSTQGLVSLQGEKPEIVVPTVGLSVETLGTAARTALRIESRKTISGEFTFDHGQLWLTLRVNGLAKFHGVFAHGNPTTPAALQ